MNDKCKRINPDRSQPRAEQTCKNCGRRVDSGYSSRRGQYWFHVIETVR